MHLDDMRVFWRQLHEAGIAPEEVDRRLGRKGTLQVLNTVIGAQDEAWRWPHPLPGVFAAVGAEEEATTMVAAAVPGVEEEPLTAGTAGEPILVITTNDTEAAEAAERPKVVITAEEVEPEAGEAPVPPVPIEALREEVQEAIGVEAAAGEPEEVREEAVPVQEVAPIEPARVEHRRPERRPEAGPEAVADRLDYMKPAATPAPARRGFSLQPSWIGVAGLALLVVVCLMALLGTYLLAPNLTGALPQATATTIVEPATETEPGLGKVVEGLAEIDGRLDNIDTRLGQLEAGAGTPPPGGVTPIPEGVGPAEGTGCRPNVWMAEAIADTEDVSSLLGVLDRDFTLRDGGEWSEPGYVVPGGSVFWTDLFENRAIAQCLRCQGGWGIYYAPSDLTMPSPNGGGRWMRLCAPFTTNEVAEAAPPPGETTEPEAAPPVALACQVPDLTGLTVVQAIKAMDDWFQEEGYQFGSAFAVGDSLPAGAIFWTNLGEGFVIPSHITPVKVEGNWGVFMTTQTFTTPSGGRYVSCNSG